MGRFWELLCSPGARKEVVTRAPTQHVHRKGSDASSPSASVENIKGLDLKPKLRLLDRWLDIVVLASGSGPVFTVIVLGLVAWAFLGIPYYDSIDWQVVISDVQAILSYIFDSLLMRQQLNTYDEGILVAAQLQSRSHANSRMLEKVERMLATGELVRSEKSKTAADEFDRDLPKESLFGRIVTQISVCYGHILTVVLYWMTIIVWLAFGPSNDWSDEWQLWMNSATSALMVFTFAFLANIRERHSIHSKKCIDAAFRVDSALERRLRLLTDDDLENDWVAVPREKVNPVQRAIYYYADVVGTLVGIALLIIVIIAWIAIGPLLQFNDNWWLIIGTYAGLVGLNDGFVLLNVQANLRKHESVQYEQVDVLDRESFRTVKLPPPADKSLEKNSWSFSLSLKMSTAVGKVCAHPIAVIMDVLLIVGLLTGSSVMGWNTTGQLLSNVPPSIIESFLMIILLPGHNSAESERRVQLDNFYERRLELINFVDSLEVVDDPQIVVERVDVDVGEKLAESM
ncbi:hypothetical protein AMS68_008027 [Peltaster fructicola]|uniref:Low affinity iron permease n=1 Tax=Peltaster fructicola TaxID=286661 RepID=A0A6H0Y7C5_9PEZI|nr:hypothetical protein AMS68_008027 [Peltaster fructicola]